MRTVLIAVSGAGFLGGCATVPEVTLTYYHAKWSSVATVTQTVGCNAAKNRAVALNAASVTTTYSSDPGKPFRIKVKDLEGAFADSDMTMTFTDDGRLKTINQSSTGQGEAIVKSAIALATALPGLLSIKSKPQPLPECGPIDSWGSSKPITLTYRATINSATLGSTVELEPGPESKELFDELKGALPKPKVGIGEPSESKSGPAYDERSPGSSGGIVLLELQKTAFVDLKITYRDEEIGTSRIVVPEGGNYKLPIPKAALFGKQTFTLTLSEAGAVTSVGYGKTTGVAGALNALTAIANMDSPAARAAELKAEADLIAQQQRVVLCTTKPEQCK